MKLSRQVNAASSSCPGLIDYGSEGDITAEQVKKKRKK
jgi:hypothetical protein